jgi:hypothetical protein
MLTFPWLRAAPYLIILALIAALAIQGSRVSNLQEKLAGCQQGRAADRATYEAAQAQAAEKNRAQVRTIEQKQEAANAQAVSNLSARLERLRSELRASTGASKGGAGSAGLSEAGGGSSAPGASGLCLTPEELLHGASNEERHDELITLVEQLIRITNE